MIRTEGNDGSFGSSRCENISTESERDIFFADLCVLQNISLQFAILFFVVGYGSSFPVFLSIFNLKLRNFPFFLIYVCVPKILNLSMRRVGSVQ